ncbi:MAG: hypothetical protein V3T81_06865 [Thermoanaerobaculia bacterium]
MTRRIALLGSTGSIGESVLEVVAAMVGAAGLRPVHAALDAGKDVPLANKESLVVAGPLLVRLARSRAVELVPVDSEHAALHQALRCGRGSRRCVAWCSPLQEDRSCAGISPPGGRSRRRRRSGIRLGTWGRRSASIRPP